MQQALAYAETLDVPFVFSTNGDGFLFHDRLETSGAIEHELPLDQFPSSNELWASYCQAKNIAYRVQPAHDCPSAERRLQSYTGIKTNLLFSTKGEPTKNPHDSSVAHTDPDKLLADYQRLMTDLQQSRNRLKDELFSAL